MLTEAQLRQIMPNLNPVKAAALLPHLNRAMAEYGINTLPRAAAFVAQLAHESGEFRWMEEIWGPTPAQRRYEPSTDLSKKLGNTQRGDGKRFKGRGPIQLTGRANYQRFGQLLGIDMVSAPEQAATPTVGFRTAALYWASRSLNELADAWNFREITHRINGGYNGLADRQKYFERAKTVLATAFQGIPRMAAPGRAAAPAREVPTEPLTRGYEAIRRLTAPKERETGSSVKTVATRKAPTKRAGATKAPPKRTARKKPSSVKKRATRKAPGKKRTTRMVKKKASAAPRARARRR